MKTAILVLLFAALLTSGTGCHALRTGQNPYHANHYRRGRLSDDIYVSQSDQARERLERERRWNQDQR